MKNATVYIEFELSNKGTCLYFDMMAELYTDIA